MPPPETARESPTLADTDRVHAATLHADRQIFVPNLLFVVQRDLSGSGSTGLTLMSSRPGADGSRMIFGTSQNVASLDRLAGLEIRVGGYRLFDSRGNGVFTSMVAYQPKAVTVSVNKVAEGEVGGTISGDFYRFQAFRAAGAPDIVRVEGTFTAVLIVR